MYDILTGKQRALVFPVMCNGHVKIDYSENVPDSADDVGYGIWSHSGDFTFEAIVTPYDINGAFDTTLRGRTLTASTKIMPNNGHESTLTNYQSEKYLPVADRITHEMRIFSSTNFYISLKNATTTTANQPAEYKILVGVKLSSGAVQEFLTDSSVILPSRTRSWVYSSDSDYYGINADGRVEYDQFTTVNPTDNDNNDVITCSSITANMMVAGEEVFIIEGGILITLSILGCQFQTSLPTFKNAAPFSFAGAVIKIKDCSLLDPSCHVFIVIVLDQSFLCTCISISA